MHTKNIILLLINITIALFYIGCSPTSGLQTNTFIKREKLDFPENAIVGRCYCECTVRADSTEQKKGLG